MLIATAGHVDHGKTALVKALTGVDTDRLPEEKRRGLSIDLGFAYKSLNGRMLGFIDVPGHQRFVHNMLAGIAGIDLALLVVAADDGVMPQTLEHVTILSLLGISQALVAITKCDRVSESRIAEVKYAVTSLLENTALAGAPMFALSTVHGIGIEVLRAALAQQAESFQTKDCDQGFRLAIDRCFTVTGAGLVVTGTVFAGQVQRTSKLYLAPVDSSARVRVRGIHAQGKAAEMAYAGQRCALNITATAVDLSAIVRRGQWLVDSRAWLTSNRIDVHLQLLSCAKPLKHWTALHIHHGSADVSGRVAIFDNQSMAPGSSGFAQLVLDHKIGVCWGDRVVLRDQSARCTLAGAVVVDPQARRNGRKQRHRCDVLKALSITDPIIALTQAVANSTTPFEVAGFVCSRNLSPTAEQQLYDAAEAVTVALPTISGVIHRSLWHTLKDQVNHLIGDWHRRHAEFIGPTIQQLGVAMAQEFRPLLVLLLAQWVLDGTFIKEGRCYRQPQHQVQLPEAEALVLRCFSAQMESHILQPLSVAALAAQWHCAAEVLQHQLQQLAFKGFLIHFGKYYLLPQAVEELALIAAAIGVDGHRFRVNEYRDRAAIGRNFAIAVLEYFDSRRLTRRLGDERLVINAVNKIFD